MAAVRGIKSVEKTLLTDRYDAGSLYAVSKDFEAATSRKPWIAVKTFR